MVSGQKLRPHILNHKQSQENWRWLEALHLKAHLPWHTSSSKAKLPKSSLKSAMNWEPSVQMPETVGDIFVQTTTPGDTRLASWHYKLTNRHSTSKLGECKRSFLPSLCVLCLSIGSYAICLLVMYIRWLSCFLLACQPRPSQCCDPFIHTVPWWPKIQNNPTLVQNYV